MTEATEIRLVVSPESSFPALKLPGSRHPGDELLVWQYPAGDVDILCWPLKNWKERMMLAEKLFEAREWAGELPQSTEAVVLPDGEKFVIEDELPSERHEKYDEWRAWLKDINPYRW